MTFSSSGLGFADLLEKAGAERGTRNTRFEEADSNKASRFLGGWSLYGFLKRQPQRVHDLQGSSSTPWSIIPVQILVNLLAFHARGHHFLEQSDFFTTSPNEYFLV
jgi:hypothetical protein